MKFYSKIVDKPNSIIEEIRNGTQVISRKEICTFINGVFETNDPRIIAKLEVRKDLFRTDRPWIRRPNWRTTDEGIKLLEEGTRLGIDCRHIAEWFLKKRIQDIKNPPSKEPEAPEVNKKTSISSNAPKPEKVEVKEIVEGEPNEAYKEAMELEKKMPKPTTPEVKVDYKEIMRLAKEKGIKTFGVKKSVLIKKLKGSGINV